MKNKWVVTRQCYWPDGRNVVEIAFGGLDYANADALCSKYQGEFQEFSNPREAAETAIAICKAWRMDGQKNAKVAVGSTGGYTMPFDPITFKEVLEWADKEYESLPKCAQCGDLMGEEKFGNHEYGEYECCSEHCAEKYYAPLEEEIDSNP